MTIKTICALTFKIDTISGSYIEYEIEPLASMFADSADEAIISYINKIIRLHVEELECYTMEVTLACGDSVIFYRVKGKNIAFKGNVISDYIVIDVPFICS